MIEGKMASKQSGVRRGLSKFNIEVNSRPCDVPSESSSDEDISDDSCYTDSDCEFYEDDEDFLKACCILDDRLLLYFQHLYTNNSERKAMAAKNADELVAEEEREKRKSEKRKAKKKRRREKKKEEKERTSNNKSEHTVDKQESSEKRSTKSSAPGSDTLAFSSPEDDEEEFLDVNSAFVSVAVSKKKKNSTTSTGMEKTRSNPKKTQVSPDQIVAESERLAAIGYRLASKEQYEQSVEFFTKAIQLVHDDHRFFSNRSFCHCHLGNYTKALKDADKAINLAPSNPKGYYRRGEAMKGLSQFKKAEEAFERVIELDEECEDAVQELKFVKLQQLLEMGFPEKMAITALQHHHTVQAAINALTVHDSENYINNHGREIAADIVFSDEDENIATVSSLHHTQEIGVQQNQPILKANKMDPSNPEGHLSLWVGNVSQEVTEKQLIELFSKFGIVISVRLLPEKYCAFINFRDKNSPGPAMKCLQNREIGGERLLIRYPNNPVPEAHQQIIVKKIVKSPVTGVQTKVTGPVNGDECHFWRTTGCAFGSKCRYKHLKENKGVDKKPWQKAS